MHHSYIIRVYRQEKDNPCTLVGTVEKVGEQIKSTFTNMDELWEIVNAGREMKRSKTKWGNGEVIYKSRRKPADRRAG